MSKPVDQTAQRYGMVARAYCLHSATSGLNLIDFASSIAKQPHDPDSEIIEVGDGFVDQCPFMIEDTYKRNALHQLKYPSQGRRAGGFAQLIGPAVGAGLEFGSHLKLREVVDHQT